MKLSAGTIGTLLFTAVAITAFVFMAKRPAVEGNAMNFGMPIQSTAVEEKVEEKMPEATTTEPAVSGEEATTPVIPDANMPLPTDTDVKTEEMPAPTTDGGTTTN